MTEKKEMTSLQRTMSRLFGGFDLEGGRAGYFPAVDVAETEKEYVFTADVPGLQKDDVHVEVDKGLLKIRGERKEHKEEKGKNFLRKEHFYGSFNRIFPLPADAKTDNVKADYKNGVLTVRVVRAEELKPKSVKIDVQ
jgi:HSP20 family protein